MYLPNTDLTNTAGFLQKIFFKIGDMKSMFLNSTTKIGEASHQTWFKEWRNLVENYSNRLLTKQPDILPALSSLARRHQTLHMSQYLAGLWARSFS
jgi:hypothetical protein